MTFYHPTNTTAQFKLEDVDGDPKFALQNDRDSDTETFLQGGDVCKVEIAGEETADFFLENDYTDGAEVKFRIEFHGQMKLWLDPSKHSDSSSTWELKFGDSTATLDQSDGRKEKTIDLSQAQPFSGTVKASRLLVENTGEGAAERVLVLTKKNLAKTRQVNLGFNIVKADVDPDTKEAKLDVAFSARSNGEKADPKFRIKSRHPATFGTSTT